MKWRIGCSGFYYKDWKGIFYPQNLPQSQWLKFYCEHFNTVELNVTFYRFPTIENMKLWFRNTPEHFLFSVKVPRLITHYKKFNDCKKLMEDFYSICKDGLKNKLGCVLFQLPPVTKYSDNDLQKIVSHLDPDFKNAVEFRDTSWWNKNVYDAFSEHKIIFCNINHSKFPGYLIETSEVLYLRMHGKPQLYKSKYPVNELKELYENIAKRANFKDVYIYFNNTSGTSAIANAEEMKVLSKMQNIKEENLTSL